MRVCPADVDCTLLDVVIDPIKDGVLVEDKLVYLLEQLSELAHLLRYFIDRLFPTLESF